MRLIEEEEQIVRDSVQYSSSATRKFKYDKKTFSGLRTIFKSERLFSHLSCFLLLLLSVPP